MFWNVYIVEFLQFEGVGNIVLNKNNILFVRCVWQRIYIYDYNVDRICYLGILRGFCGLKLLDDMILFKYCK